jgi:hypothetical protein
MLYEYFLSRNFGPRNIDRHRSRRAQMRMVAVAVNSIVAVMMLMLL